MRDSDHNGFKHHHGIEIWEEHGKFWKKVYDENHEKGGAETEISEEEFNELKQLIEEK